MAQTLKHASVLIAAARAAWAPITVFLLHAALAGVYGHEPYVDPMMHFLGGAAVAYWFTQLFIAGHQKLGEPTLLVRTSLVVGSTSIVTLLWELIELAHDVFIIGKSNTTPANTLADQMLGVLGALALVAFIYWNQTGAKNRSG